MSNLITTTVTRDLQEDIDGLTVAQAITFLKSFEDTDEICVEYSYDDVDITVQRSREKTEEELKFDAIDAELEKELRELHKKSEEERTSISVMISRTKTDLADLQFDFSEIDREQIDKIRVIRSHYAQRAETVI